MSFRAGRRGIAVVPKEGPLPAGLRFLAALGMTMVLGMTMPLGMTSGAQLAQQLVDHPERGVDIVLIDHQRRRQTQCALASAQQQKASAERALDQLVHELG